MSKKTKIQQEREKRQAQLAQLQQQQASLQSQLGQVNTLIMKITGALEQLAELEPVASENGTPVKTKKARAGKGA